MNIPVIIYTLGRVIAIESAFMTLPGLVALIYRENVWWSYFLVALLGMLLIWNYHGKPGQRIPMLISYGFYPLHILLLLTAGGLIHPQANIISMLHF